MARLFRRDFSNELGKPETLSNGWVRVDGFISRTGIQVYERDGKEFKEYRPPDEVFHADTIASFVSVPLTNNHPSGGALNAHNTKAYQCGTVEAPRQDGTRTRARLLITDASTIELLKSGKTQLSCGYMCDLDETPGTTPEGDRYDAVQRNIVGNHVALVDEARGGPELRVRMDSAGVLFDAAERVVVTSPVPSQTPKESEVTVEELKKALEAQAKAEARADSADKALASLQAELSKAQARADMAEAEAKAAPARAAAAAKARVDLEAKAKTVLPTVKVDGKSDAEIKRQVIESRGTVKVDGKSEAYLDAAFDLVCEMEPREDSAHVASISHEDSEESEGLSAAQKAFQKRMDSPFKPSAV